MILYFIAGFFHSFSLWVTRRDALYRKFEKYVWLLLFLNIFFWPLVIFDRIEIKKNQKGPRTMTMEQYGILFVLTLVLFVTIVGWLKK
jgi:hypothetical protein